MSEEKMKFFRLKDLSPHPLSLSLSRKKKEESQGFSHAKVTHAKAHNTKEHKKIAP